jgi:hypothetical protein
MAFKTKSPRSPDPDALRAVRAVPEDRRVWAGLHTTAEYLVGGLDTAAESVALTSGAWSAIKLVSLALATVGRPARVDIWTWTVSRKAIARLQAWQREGVSVRLVVDASLWRRQPTYGAALLAGSFAPCVRAASAHAKAAAVTGPAGSLFVAGSGNLNLCRRAELVWLSRDPALASWLGGVTDRAFEALPAGAPEGGDNDRADRLARAFPTTAARPTWAAGLPVLTTGGPTR